MSISTEIVKNSIWNLILFATYGLTGVFTSVLTARYLSPEFMGEYSFVIWLIGTMVILAGIGFPNTITKFISEFTGRGDSKSAQAIYATLIKIQFIIVLFITIILIGIVYPRLSPVMRDYYLFAFLSLCPLCISSFLTSAFHGLHNFKITSIIGSFINLLQLILVVVCIALDSGLRGLLAVPCISSICHALLLRKYSTFGITSPFTISQEYSKKVIKYSLSIYWIIILSVIVWQKLEIFFLKLYASSEEIAFYSIALNINTLIIGFAGLFSTVVFPVFSGYYGAGDRDGIQNIYNKSIKAIVVFFLPVCIIVIAIAKPIVSLLYSSEYLAVSPILTIFMVSSLFFALGTLLANLMLALNRTDVQVKYITLFAIINIIFDFIFIPRYGAIGAAIANSAVRIIVFPMWIWIIKKQLGFFFPSREVFRCILPNVPLAIILCFIGNRNPNLFGIFLVSFIALISYPFLLFAFRTITSDDIRTAREASTILPAPYEKVINTMFDKIPMR